MPPRKPRPAAAPHRTRHGRHGRLGRSSILRSPLPAIDSRVERFDIAVGAAAEFLRSAWPELRAVEFDVADLPPVPRADPAEIPRWQVWRDQNRIALYRIPIERLTRGYRADEHYARMVVEGFVFRAAGDYLGRDPWELGPGRFRFL